MKRHNAKAIPEKVSVRNVGYTVQ